MDIKTGIVNELKAKYPLSEPDILGEQNKKEFVKLFGTFLRFRNILSSFDEFEGNEILSERDLQDYMSRYQDTYQWIKEHQENHDSTDIIDDIVYEIELMKQIEINIDYILLLVAKYKESHCEDKELLVSIQKAIDSAPNLRSKKQLIEGFIAELNNDDDVITGWQGYVSEQKEKALQEIIETEKLKPEETRRFIEDSFEAGEIKTTGTDIDNLLPPVSRFGGSNRAKKKETVIEKLKAFFEKFFGVVVSWFTSTDTGNNVEYECHTNSEDKLKAAEPTSTFNESASTR